MQDDAKEFFDGATSSMQPHRNSLNRESASPHTYTATRNSLGEQINGIQQKIVNVEKSIADTEANILETEAAIQVAAENVFKDEQPGRDYWMRKEEDLRKEKADLRKEKSDLRKEKALMEDYLRKADLTKFLARPPEASVLADRADHARACGRWLVESIKMKEVEVIDGSDGMQVLKNVFDLETETTFNLVIRSFTMEFWRSCISIVDTPEESIRVCVVGTPGIGKSSMIPLLIRMLLKAKKQVVYICRSLSKLSWFYEFTPGENQIVDVNVYPEAVGPFSLPSLQTVETYYIVDPGNTKESCCPEVNFLPKTIIVSSPDSGHWGGSEFGKRRGNTKGRFMFFPIWTLEELLDARPVLGEYLTEDEVCERYRYFGGVPRHVFAKHNIEDELLTQDIAILCLTLEQAKKIALNDMDGVGTLNENQPKSAVIGINCKPNYGFMRYDIVVVSALVAEKVYSKFMTDLWSVMLHSKNHGWAIFEAYTRQLMTQATTLYGRKCVGKKHQDYKNCIQISLGGCTGIRLVLDIVAAASNEENVVFHSVDRRHPLIDFAYQDKHKVLHAFQVTLATNHSCNIKHVKQLVNQVQFLRLYYLIPGEMYATFVTKPVHPGNELVGLQVEIFHVLVPNPTKQQPHGFVSNS